MTPAHSIEPGEVGEGTFDGKVNAKAPQGFAEGFSQLGNTQRRHTTGIILTGIIDKIYECAGVQDMEDQDNKSEQGPIIPSCKHYD